MKHEMSKQNRPPLWFDDYRRFHHRHSFLVIFESGEIIIPSDMKPCGLRNHKSFGIGVWRTRDPIPEQMKGLEFVDPTTGRAVTKADLDRKKRQILLIDYDKGRAVTLGGCKTSEVIPNDLRSRCHVFWPSIDQPPVSSPISYWTLEACSDPVLEVIQKCRTWCALNSIQEHGSIPREAPTEVEYPGRIFMNRPDQTYGRPSRHILSESAAKEHMGMPSWIVPLIDYEKLPTIDKLTWWERVYIGLWAKTRPTVWAGHTVPYLELKPKGKTNG